MTTFSKPLEGYRFVEIRFGDTLQSIAARELGDAARWVELIAYNNLIPPYLDNFPSPRILAYGGQILVPAPVAVISSTTDPERVFESDLSLNKGLLDVDDGDFAIVSGRANLRQAVKRRIDVPRGELLFHAEYGSLVSLLLGSMNGPTTGLLAAQYASSAVLSDARVASVTKVFATVNGDVINVSMEIQPVAGQPIEFLTGV